MMETVDSKKNKLSLQEIIIRSLYAQKDRLSVPIDQAMIQLVAELQMPGSEAIQFGNTVFVTHYAQQSKTCVMYALNADNAKNYIANGEMYVRHLMKNGITGFVTSYDTESFGVPFKQIEKNKLGIVETWKQGKRFVTAVQLKASQRQGQRNA